MITQFSKLYMVGWRRKMDFLGMTFTATVRGGCT